jgi:hypothetical protein
MKNAENKLTLAEGDSLSLSILVEENDEPKNLTGSTLFFTIKKSPNDSDKHSLLRVEVSYSPSFGNGIFPVLASSAAMKKIRSGVYYYDARLLYSGSVTTLVPASPLEIVSIVTHNTL